MKRQITKAVVVIAISGITPLFADLQISNNSNLQLFPKVAKASGGQFVINWCDNRQSGGHFEIYSNAVNNNISNKVGGSDDSLSTPNPADGHRLNAEMLSSNNGAIVAWVDHNSKVVRAIRVDQNGDIDGDFNSGTGTPVLVHGANPFDNYESVQMCSDNNGGAVFVWVAKTGNGPYTHTLNVKRINSSGGIGFDSTNIISVSETDSKAEPITMPRICPAPNGEYYIAWAQVKGDPKQRWIRIVRINSSGVLQGQIDYADVITAQTAGGGYYDPVCSHNWTGLRLTKVGDKAFLTMKYCFTYVDDDHPIAAARNSSFLIRERIFVCVVSGVSTSNKQVTNLQLAEFKFDDFVNATPKITDPINREIYSMFSTPEVVENTDGSAYVVWSKETGFSNGDYYSQCHVYISKITSSGGWGWTAENVKQMDGSGFANRAPQVVSDGSNALVVWESMNSEGKNSKLRYRKITSSGTKDTEYDVSSSGNNGYSFDLINDSTNAIVVWSRKTTSTNWDIYANKFTF